MSAFVGDMIGYSIYGFLSGIAGTVLTIQLSSVNETCFTVSKSIKTCFYESVDVYDSNIYKTPK